jgi:hypothetical protein
MHRNLNRFPKFPLMPVEGSFLAPSPFLLNVVWQGSGVYINGHSSASFDDCGIHSNAAHVS